VTNGTLILRYGLFAVIATLANLGAQRCVLAFAASAMGFALAVAAGTVIGLVVKYLLDRRWIFGDRETGLRAHGRKFARYTGTGAVTTLIFWGSETGFWLIWRDDLMREVGAVLGLAVGYMAKYQFDRHYVFGGTGERA
jgi:putative flippase GtrA